MKIIKIEDGAILFNDGTTITDFHYQDCCEHVYADFSQLKDTTIFNEEINEIKIEGVEGSGFRLNGYFVPCYNSQNGYYSSDLALIITSPGKEKKEIDISNFVKDQID